MFRQQTSRITSASFEKTRSYFENDLFTDTALHELQLNNENDTRQLSDVNCLELEVNDGGIFIASSENFIIYGRRTLKLNTFKKWQISDKKNVHVEYFLKLNHKNCDELFVALNDGTVKAFTYPSIVHQMNAHTEYGIDLSISPLTFVPVNTPSKPASATCSEHNLSASQNQITSNAAFSIGQELGKSCIIQNIVQNERKLYNNVQTFGIFDTNELQLLNDDSDVGNCINEIHLQPNIVNNQLICFQPKHKIHSNDQILSLNKLNCLIFLKKNQLKLYNLLNGKIIDVNYTNELQNCSLIQIASIIDDNGFEYLVSFVGFSFFIVSLFIDFNTLFFFLLSGHL